jgi:predicted AlkP superfamily pyrophosphatase or phosphodiesterase
MIVCYAFVVARRLRAILYTLLLAVTVSLPACAARSDPPVLPSAQPPIVILVSIDGWRWDYTTRFQPPAISRLALHGVQAEGLIPAFPSKTFPNHYTIITGLHPATHGVTSNNMIDPRLPGRFTLSDRDVQQDSRWWGGEPLWVTAERQGRIAGTMFWPGSDVEIAGDRPTYWRPYEHEFPNHARVDALLEWLAAPPERQATFLTLYFSDVDDAGHAYGPDGEQTRAAVLAIDHHIERLVAGVEALGLGSRVHYILVSDHGMAQLSPERIIVLDDYIDLETVDLVDVAPIVGLNPKPGVSTEAIYRALKDKHPALDVYLGSNLPEVYRLRNHPRTPAIVGIADDGWHPTLREWQRRGEEFRFGNHGYDPIHRSMHGLFVASGPMFKSGVSVPAFSNLHIYELVCRVLGIKPAPNEGDPRVTASFLRSSPSQ